MWGDRKDRRREAKETGSTVVYERSYRLFSSMRASSTRQEGVRSLKTSLSTSETFQEDVRVLRFAFINLASVGRMDYEMANLEADKWVRNTWESNVLAQVSNAVGVNEDSGSRMGRIKQCNGYNWQAWVVESCE